jgi:hypothetical protein
MVRLRMSNRSAGKPGSHSLLRFNWPLRATQEQMSCACFKGIESRT